MCGCAGTWTTCTQCGSCGASTATDIMKRERVRRAAGHTPCCCSRSILSPTQSPPTSPAVESGKEGKPDIRETLCVRDALSEFGEGRLGPDDSPNWRVERTALQSALLPSSPITPRVNGQPAPRHDTRLRHERRICMRGLGAARRVQCCGGWIASGHQIWAHAGRILPVSGLNSGSAWATVDATGGWAWYHTIKPRVGRGKPHSVCLSKVC